MDWICVMCGGEIPPNERDAPYSYAAMFSGRRPKVLHARCAKELRHGPASAVGYYCSFNSSVDEHAATEYCPFCFWIFCAEHSPHAQHSCNQFQYYNTVMKTEVASDDWSATSIIEEAGKVVGVRSKQYNAKDGPAERSMRQVVAVVNALRGDATPLTIREGWLFMLALKLVRASLPTPSRDTFIDIAGYAGLAGEERGEELKR